MAGRRKPRVSRGVEVEEVKRVRRADGDISYLGFMVMVLGMAGLIGDWKTVLLTAAVFGSMYMFAWVMKMLYREK